MPNTALAYLQAQQQKPHIKIDNRAEIQLQKKIMLAPTLLHFTPPKTTIILKKKKKNTIE